MKQPKIVNVVMFTCLVFAIISAVSKLDFIPWLAAYFIVLALKP